MKLITIQFGITLDPLIVRSTFYMKAVRFVQSETLIGPMRGAIIETITMAFAFRD